MSVCLGGIDAVGRWKWTRCCSGGSSSQSRVTQLVMRKPHTRAHPHSSTTPFTIYVNKVTISLHQITQSCSLPPHTYAVSLLHTRRFIQTIGDISFAHTFRIGERAKWHNRHMSNNFKVLPDDFESTYNYDHHYYYDY